MTLLPCLRRAICGGLGNWIVILSLMISRIQSVFCFVFEVWGKFLEKLFSPESEVELGFVFGEEAIGNGVVLFALVGRVEEAKTLIKPF